MQTFWSKVSNTSSEIFKHNSNCYQKSVTMSTGDAIGFRPQFLCEQANISSNRSGWCANVTFSEIVLRTPSFFNSNKSSKHEFWAVMDNVKSRIITHWRQIFKDCKRKWVSFVLIIQPNCLWVAIAIIFANYILLIDRWMLVYMYE